MRTCLICLLSALSNAYFVFAQTLKIPASNLYLQSNNYSSYFRNAFSFTSNEAALAECKSFSAGLYSEKRFMLEDLGLYSTVVELPVKNGGFGWHGSYFGNASYNESVIGLAYGRSVTAKLHLGLGFNYNHFKEGPTQTEIAFTTEAGLLYHLSDQFIAGIHIYNPERLFNLNNARGSIIPSFYSTQFGYTLSESLYAGCDLIKETEHALYVNIQIQYAFNRKAFVRTGLSTSNNACFFGIGFLTGAITVNAVASFQPFLGLTPGLLLLFNREGH